MNIAIFSGSFDPPHNAHEIIIKQALKDLQIDKLIIIPAFLNPFKDKFFAPPNLRLKWCQKLWINLPKVEISDFEIKQNRAVRSIESVEYFLNLYKPEICYFLIGADQLNGLKNWYKFDELSNLVKFVVALRDNISVPSGLQKLSINAKISSTKMRQNLNFDGVSEKIRPEVVKFYKEKYAK